jgi:hypothetical protein
VWNYRIATGTSVCMVDTEAFALAEQRACRLALAPRLLLWKAITPAPTGHVTGMATKQSCRHRGARRIAPGAMR